jgi:hypothetical protein
MARSFELEARSRMLKDKKLDLILVAVGVSGTVLIALFIIVVGVPIPPLKDLIQSPDKPWGMFLAMSTLFFFPPYVAVTGLIGLRTSKTKEDEPSTREFMSSYAYTEKSKKDWIKHLAASMTGITNAVLMWSLMAIYGL